MKVREKVLVAAVFEVFELACNIQDWQTANELLRVIEGLSRRENDDKYLLMAYKRIDMDAKAGLHGPGSSDDQH
ncbi:hypothetical protein [Permianibacter aggregans]|uniref:Uncharacterized protein n=1 Tax=Permianibacter aggregans TaxID=1510150 RepID=A0A4R6UHZ8_9GAMM|nr:hypothetical protein [Permianibacter aggregans]QGX38173.1 hypothetical protein E2H98_00200 [Permianibacter aggregans]TDQ44979.1 hypothetical protein EV696_12235 [Permianibacter aggregans]